MTQSLHTPATTPPVSHDLKDPDHGAAVVVDDALLDLTWGRAGWGRAVFWIAVAFSTFQIITAAWSPLPSQIVRSVHVGFLLLVVFAIAGNHKSGLGQMALWGLGILSFVVGLYHWVFYSDLIARAGDPSTLDIVVGTVAVALVFEGSRRLMGLSLPIICAGFILYGLFGQYLPPPLDHRPFDYVQVVDQMFLGTEGIYGTPTYVSSSYIFLFILFGAFLERAGMIQLFNDVAMGTVGHARGGPAKVAVFSSALMGTINGSGVANVVTTGQFTIPLMKNFGYRPAFAGAVEATASMGGQIMPPVMGAVAFIMAETIDVPYATIATAAVIPAFLYFFTVFAMVHLEAGKYGLSGLPKAQCPNAWQALKKRWYLLAPLAVLVWLLFSGYTPLFAGTVGLALTALIVLGTPVARVIGPYGLRVLFWIVLGVAAASFVEYGINGVAAAVGVLVLVLLVVKGGRETLAISIESMADGARNALPVGIACALVGTMIGVFTLTGVATTFATFVVEVGKNSLFLSLILTMIACLILGMGLPTIPNYIITASIAGPALLALGVPLIVSHMFVFYFGIMADLTPPVALAAFAAAPIAGASGQAIGWIATRIALAGYVVPFMAVYSPALMLQDGDPMAGVIGFWPAVVYVFVKAVVAILLWAGTATGYLLSPLSVLERIAAFAAAALLILSLPWTDEAGFAATAAFIAWHVWRTRARQAAA
ncbi:TRAP transporter permease [Xanthobacter agilis]|uniref:TRAP transporter 4TM/12TM fusion protein n=1 Tax=Xanthobacter agilis TaxID=47492 RepID=A0ABU0LGI6_XANAG|nr:TRAP transporter permease [Xanthobacter agilis]MDQ0506257.1 TRAP transporter 4TM/12TM fusion protein [Xanthobacter agilis]